MGCELNTYGPNCELCERCSHCDPRYGCSAECSDGYYGAQCTTSCSPGCKDSYCFSINGDCKHRCKSKEVIGRNCSECIDGYHWIYSNEFSSFNCKQCVGACKTGTTCNKNTGECDDGCAPGLKGRFCNETCHSGYFGQNCSSECYGCKDSLCDAVDGDCRDGCRETNLIGNTCSKCTAGYYLGRRWNKDQYINYCSECSNCLTKTACEEFTGFCLDGCLAGWRGDKCRDKCGSGTYGFNCSSTCSRNCAESNCHHISGDCINKLCKGNWTGKKCDGVLLPSKNFSGMAISATAIRLTWEANNKSFPVKTYFIYQLFEGSWEIIANESGEYTKQVYSYVVDQRIHPDKSYSFGIKSCNSDMCSTLQKVLGIYTLGLSMSLNIISVAAIAVGSVLVICLAITIVVWNKCRTKRASGKGIRHGVQDSSADDDENNDNQRLPENVTDYNEYDTIDESINCEHNQLDSSVVSATEQYQDVLGVKKADNIGQENLEMAHYGNKSGYDGNISEPESVYINSAYENICLKLNDDQRGSLYIAQSSDDEQQGYLYSSMCPEHQPKDRVYTSLLPNDEQKSSLYTSLRRDDER